MSTLSASTAAAEPTRQDGLLYTAGPALVSGASQAILFNPIDRALYVRVKHRRRRFLDKRNFERPFQGFMNAAVYRTLVGASYMFWQDSMRITIECLAPAACQVDAAPQLNSMMIGLSAGSVNGFALNTLQAVKFRMWNTDERGITFWRTALNMHREGGMRIFFRGCVTTMVRDSIFGIVYETTRRASAWKAFFERQVLWCSSTLANFPGAASTCSDTADSYPVIKSEVLPVAHEMPGAAPVIKAKATDKQKDASSKRDERVGVAAFVSNLVAAVTASMMSSPFNYVRSIVYGTPPGAIPLGYLPLLKSFYTQFYYTYRHGKSYTDRFSMPELSETEHRATSSSLANHSSGASSTASGTSSATASSSTTRPRLGSSATEKIRGTECGASGAAASASPAEAPASSARSRPPLRTRWHSAVRQWADVHHHHPIAAWKWANSRLNIGWGSIRVGLGMAMGQTLFYLAQDIARAGKRRKATADEAYKATGAKQ